MLTSSMQHFSDATHASLIIWYIQDGFKDGNRQILQTPGSGTLPIGISDGFVTVTLHVEQHFINTCTWINEPSMHV